VPAAVDRNVMSAGSKSGSEFFTEHFEATPAGGDASRPYNCYPQTAPLPLATSGRHVSDDF